MENDVKKQSQKVIYAGLGVNAFLAVSKLLAGIYGHSQTMVADSINQMGDILTDIALLFGVNFWTAPPDRTHPHGHRRIETFITIIISITVAASALFIGYRAVVTFNEPHTTPPGIIALVTALFAMVLKEIIYRITYTAGKKIRSPAIIAKALDHRTDAIEAIPVSIAVAISIFKPEWTFVDHIGALIVSVFILQMSVRAIIIPSFLELTDAGADARMCVVIEKLCLECEGVRSIHKLRTRRIGSLWEVELHAQVDGNTTVRNGHVIAGGIKHRLLDSRLDIIDVTVHVEPAETLNA